MKRSLSKLILTIILSAIHLPSAAALTIGEHSVTGSDVLTLTGSTSISAVGNTAITGTLTTSGATTITDATQSTSTATGSIITSGGIGVAKNAYIGGGIYQNGSLLLPPGTIMMYGANAAPDGYLLCNGSAVSRITYAGLFAVIGTTFGAGDGSTTFNLPDFRNKLPMGAGDSYAIGTTGGNSTVTLTTNELPSHTHTGTTEVDGSHTHEITDPGHSHGRLNAKDDNNGSNNPGQAPVGDANTNYETGYPTESATTGISINAGGAHSHEFTTDATGDGEAFSILNPYLAITYIIKY